jgi:hypothetical protein
MNTLDLMMRTLAVGSRFRCQNFLWAAQALAAVLTCVGRNQTVVDE